MRRTLPLVACLFLPLVLLLRAGEPPRTGPSTEKRFPPLKLPPGFKATLFACDPLIEYPSVIAAGPRPGAIFVAVDYMTGLGTDGKVKSEIRLVEDTDGDGYADKATIVGNGFNSIQGIAYRDGVVYVMHAPFLTTLRFSSPPAPLPEGEGRKNLLSGLGLTPEQNLVRLHCANGVTIGHDGWLYLAMGDNGVNVLRPEGDRLILNGGGILRCRPDGRDLHVFSTGLRNIYDVALDAELNVFTRDNENDGGTYMIRVCHCFHGSDHGYPYLYGDRPDEAMPPIGDFGLGSSAGGVCYLETQFPPEYRGNLFFGEWGRSVVRYPLQRAGSGFAPVKEFEFASGDPKDTYPFKPTDVVVQRDGTMMVADYADGQRPKRGRGRIYHVSYADKDYDQAKKKAEASHLAKLDSESYFERWEAQSAIERSSAKLDVNKLGARGSMHAIWVLARRDGAQAIDELLRLAKDDPDMSVRAQAVRAIADLGDPVLVTHKLDAGRGDAKLAEQLAALGEASDARVMLEVVIALGRLRWEGGPDWLRRNLGKADATLAHAAMQTLRRADNWPGVMKLLDEPNESPVRTIALRGLANRYDLAAVDGVIERLKSASDSDRRRDYADLLTRVYKKPAPWKYWGYRPGPRPANTEAWERTGAIEDALDRALAGTIRADRLSALKRMQREKVPVRLTTLAAWLKDERQPEAVAAIIGALSDFPAADVRQHFDVIVLDRDHAAANRLASLALSLKGSETPSPQTLTKVAQSIEDGPVLADVLRRLGSYPNAGGAAVVAAKLKSPNGGVRAAAIEALGNMGAAEGREPALLLLRDTDMHVRRAAAAAVGKLGVSAAVEPLLKLASDADPGMRLACLDSLRRLRESRVVPFAVAALNDPHMEMKALECLLEQGGPQQLSAVVEFAKRNPTLDGPAAAVRVLTAWRDRASATPAQRQSLDRAVAEIHGEGGVLARWDASSPVADPDARRFIEHFAAIGKTPLDWHTLLAVGSEGRVVLAPKESTKDARYLSITDVAVPANTPVEFLASSRGAFEVWLNGKSIHRRAQPGNFQIDSDRFPGVFDKGVNRLLVQTASSTGTVEFHLRFRRKSLKAEHEKLTQAALARAGNPERGRKIFFDKEKSQCIQCHQIGGQGERVGPELTGVGSRFSRIYLVESILEPSRTIAPSFGTLTLTLKNGKTLNGVKVAETDTTITVADNQGLKHVLTKADIDEQHPSPISSMPEGLEKRLSQDEFVDLLAFLTSQKSAGVSVDAR